jgi:hypothetical protein
MLEMARSQVQQFCIRHRFRFKNKLLSINATTIELCASVFDWAQFRRTKGRRQAASDTRSPRPKATMHDCGW